MASRCSATTGAVASIRASWAGVSMAGGSLWVRRGGCYFKMHAKYILSDPTATPCPDAGCRTRSVGPDDRHQQPPGQHAGGHDGVGGRSEEHTSELQSRPHLVCRLLLEKKKKKKESRSTRST